MINDNMSYSCFSTCGAQWFLFGVSQCVYERMRVSWQIRAAMFSIDNSKLPSYKVFFFGVSLRVIESIVQSRLQLWLGQIKSAAGTTDRGKKHCMTAWVALTCGRYFTCFTCLSCLTFPRAGDSPLRLVHRKRPPQVSRIHSFPHILPTFLWLVGAFFGVPTQVQPPGVTSIWAYESSAWAGSMERWMSRSASTGHPCSHYHLHVWRQPKLEVMPAHSLQILLRLGTRNLDIVFLDKFYTSMESMVALQQRRAHSQPYPDQVQCHSISHASSWWHSISGGQLSPDQMPEGWGNGIPNQTKIASTCMWYDKKTS